jgi:hypothetical protein
MLVYQRVSYHWGIAIHSPYCPVPGLVHQEVANPQLVTGPALAGGLAMLVKACGLTWLLPTKMVV